MEGQTAFHIALLNKDQHRIPLKTRVLELEENKEYSFEITGDSESGAALKRIGKADG
ncbi:hypothetical protein [Salibacterium halotolerans]|uniref:hypothetical protein n=1 Tax=Salibacterium halotolerans TaxID=1884432 RepID=UPI0014799DAD|nr:hypothetical protein [Salibacterium halotolerans]